LECGLSYAGSEGATPITTAGLGFLIMLAFIRALNLAATNPVRSKTMIYTRYISLFLAAFLETLWMIGTTVGASGTLLK
jgi:hypothetical protein